MNLVTHETAVTLWQTLIKSAEHRCAVELKEELEFYIISLIIRHIDKPEIVHQIIATTFLEGLQMRGAQRNLSLQAVGDQCLLFAGFFPRIAAKRHVNISYFVDLGRSAYSAISKNSDDLYGSLAYQFVVLMDILQSMRPDTSLLPLEAYEQWQSVGSLHALKILQGYTKGLPNKK